MSWKLLFGGLLSALVPEEPRARIVRTVGVDPPFWSFVLGVVQLLIPTLLLVDDFLTVMPELVSAHTGAFLDRVSPAEFGKREIREAFYLGGSFSWLHWILRPKVMVLASFPLWGLVRLAAFATTREAVAEPVVWIGFRLWDLMVKRPARSVNRRVRFGADRPDRLEPISDDRLEVWTARVKTDWNEAVTIEHDGRFYRMAGLEERRYGSHWWYVYELREESPAAVIRRLVRYEPGRSENRSPASTTPRDEAS
ncbi:MAG: hypothetical protein R3234_06200 [Thermoanaerobaculia bacterium]|nr:hypothetical protein [Thermoanaerobaculia bacterium]